METIQVVIADRSQLVRMGLTGILYQTGGSLNIRETPDADKLKNALKKEHVQSSLLANHFCNSAPMIESGKSSSDKNPVC